MFYSVSTDEQADKGKSNFINKKRMIIIIKLLLLKLLLNIIISHLSYNLIMIITKIIIFDVTVPVDKRIGEKDNEKVEKYQEL